MLKDWSQIKKILIYILIVGFLTPLFLVFAQNQDMEEKCLLLTEKGCEGKDASLCRKELKECEEYYNRESQKIEQDMQKTSQEKKTLQSKIYRLNKKIKELSYKINQSNLMIKDLKIQINNTLNSIEKNTLKIEELKKKIALILKAIYEEEQKPAIEILLAEKSLSSFFDNLIALEALNSKNKDLLKDLKVLKASLEKQKESLSEETNELESAVKMHQLQKQESYSLKKEQEYHLELTEQEYQKQLQEKKTIEQKVAAIRARIFELVGISKAPTFGEAYEIAKYVEKMTGVRPAFLLAVLQQESAIGKNVGQCYLTNTLTGAGVSASGRTLSRVMKPSRDVTPFLEITKKLGLDYKSTPVSCPMSFGWGGAMGPAQFIPSTWMLYRDKLKSLLKREPNPWNIKDAFLAAGLYLSEAGAARQTYNSEWRAAMIYFSGSTNPRYSFYGNSVMKIAQGFQEEINLLKQFAKK